MSWSAEVQVWLDEGDFDRVSAWYEHKIEADLSQNVEDYFHLGLSYLLEGREEDAQATWFLALSQTESEQIVRLVEILEGEAARRESIGQLNKSWLLRAHIREIEPGDVNNILSLYKLEIELNCLDVKKITKIQDLFLSTNASSINRDILGQFLSKLLYLTDDKIIPLIENIFNKFSDDSNLIKIVNEAITRVAKNDKLIAIHIINICLKIEPKNLYLANLLPWYYLELEKYAEARDSSYYFYQICESLPEKAFGAYSLVLVMVTGGYWLEMPDAIGEYKKAFQDSLNAGRCPSFLGRACLISSPLAYINDDLGENRALIDRNGELYQKAVNEKYAGKIIQQKKAEVLNNKIKIGYIGHTLKMHSIGIISRWLLNYHDRERFEINTYLINQTEDFITKQYFRNKSDNCYNLPDDAAILATRISDDKIDILVDLDSLTGWTTSEVMALKPADIQVSWLGWDAPGIPAIDYYIADNYVLPENAQDYYREQIWRLPDSYIAIDGVEIGIPTLRRGDLGIGSESVIYLTAQTSYKRNPESIRLQLRVLKAVPHSYLLVQGRGGGELIKSLFTRIASEEGVSPERLRFLPLYPVSNYRANLGVADVILDTYPFTGGTMTLDTLWMGIPMVTKVGQQWSSRNSYTLMVNAGLNEGIAWNDEEYIEWGIRLGMDGELRERIRWKLRQSRGMAPVWNARRFTRNIESAYLQMRHTKRGDRSR